MRQAIFRLLTALTLAATLTRGLGQKVDPRQQVQWPNLTIYVAGTPAYPTISSAVAAATLTGGVVWVPCGKYTDTITISTSNLSIIGQGIQCVTINPSSNSPVLTFAAGSGSGINYNTVRDVSIANVRSTGDGIQFTGGANTPNDRTTLERVAINGFTFGAGINIIGRAIWDRFIDVYTENNNYGFYTSSASAINRITIEGGRIGGNLRGGVYWSNTNSNASIGITFHDVNVEYNGTGTAGGGGSTAFANCAGIYLNGIASGSIEGTSYFEGNCVASTGANRGADIRLDGSFAQAFDIGGAYIGSQTAYGIYNTAVVSNGFYSGNKITNQTTSPILVAASSTSNVTIGSNFYNGGVIAETADANGNNHMSGVGPFANAEGGAAQAGNTINPISGGVLNPLTYDSVVIFNGPFTITNISGAFPGRILKLVTHGSSNTLSTAGSGSTAISLKGGASTETLGTGDYIVLQYSAVFGKWIEQFSSSNYTATSFTSAQSATITTLSAAGAGGSFRAFACDAGFVCTPNSGSVAGTMGTSPTTGDLVKITWPSALPRKPICTVNVYDNTSSATVTSLIQDADRTSTTETEFLTASALTAGHGYTVKYTCF